MNTGTPSEQRVIEDGSLLIVVPLVADDGTKNEIDQNDVIDEAYVSALINNSDPSKRWYPIGAFTNVTDERGDPITESYSDGSSAVTQESVRTWTGWLINYAAKYIENLRGFSCTKFGVFVVDDCGGLIGSISKDATKLQPIKVNNYSWYPSLMKKTDTTAGKVTLSFEFSQLEKDSDLRVILADEMGSDLDLTEIEGLREVEAEVSAITTDGFTAALTLPFDKFLGGAVSVKGWLLADFELYNETTASSIVITSVTEGPDGTYVFVIPTQTSADVLTLTGVKTGFSLGPVTITIP